MTDDYHICNTTFYNLDDEGNCIDCDRTRAYAETLEQRNHTSLLPDCPTHNVKRYYKMPLGLPHCWKCERVW